LADEKLPKKGAMENDAIMVRIVLEPQEHTPTYYANHAEVSRGAHDFGVSFAHLPTKFSKEKLETVTDEGELKYSPNVQLVLPPTVIPGLIRALQTQLDLYMQRKQRDEQESKNE